MRAFNLLADGSGGMDWAGLPLVFAYLGIDDPEPVIDAIAVIKAHRPKAEDAPTTE